MSRIIVSDSACLIGLERIRQLDLLPSLFDEVFAPPAVAREFGIVLPWLTVRAPQDAQYVAVMKLLADEGEAEAIALPKELNCEVILDDLPARKLATKQNVNVVGLLGLLVRAKNSGRVKEIRPLIQSLQRENFFFSDDLVAKALRLAKE